MAREDLLLEIAEKELLLLREFSKTLRDERDAIISFSLEGIVRENNKKEEILKKLEYLESEKEAILSEGADNDFMTSGPPWDAMSLKLEQTMAEVRTALKRNMSLLSFSIDHVKSSIDKIVHFINRGSYGKKKDGVSFLLSREI